MQKAKCIFNNWTDRIFKNRSISVQWFRHRAYIYIDKQKICFIEYGQAILCVTVTKSGLVAILCSDGIYKYKYNEDRRCIDRCKIVKIEGVLSAVADKEYLAIRVGKNTVKNTIWSVEQEMFWVVDPTCTVEDSKEIAHIRCMPDRRVLITYKCSGDNHRIEREIALSGRSSTPTKIKDQKVFSKQMLLDKKNVLSIENGEIIHGTISTQREILKGTKASILQMEKNQIKVIIDSKTYSIVEHLDGFISVEDTCDGSDKEAEEKKKAESSIECIREIKQIGKKKESRKRAECMTEPMLAYENETIYRNGIRYAKILSQTAFISCTGKYLHQLCPNGTIRVFIADAYLTLEREIKYVAVSGLISFAGMSTFTSSIFILIYSSRCSVLEYSTKYSHKVVDTYCKDIISAEKYRKDIVLCFKDQVVRYYLDRKKSLVVKKDMEVDLCTLYSLSLSAPNINVQQIPIFVHKIDKKYIVRAKEQKIVEDRFIKYFSLLHKGYIYSDGFSLILSTKEAVHFALLIKTVVTFNEPSRSTVLVHLCCGKTFLLSIQNEKMLEQTEVHQKISADFMGVTSASSFFSVFNNTLSVYTKKEYIYPTLRVSFPFLINSVFFSETIHVLTENNMIYCIENASETRRYIGRDSSIGVLFS